MNFNDKKREMENEIVFDTMDSILTKKIRKFKLYRNAEIFGAGTMAFISGVYFGSSAGVDPLLSGGIYSIAGLAAGVYTYGAYRNQKRMGAYTDTRNVLYNNRDEIVNNSSNNTYLLDLRDEEKPRIFVKK